MKSDIFHQEDVFSKRKSVPSEEPDEFQMNFEFWFPAKSRADLGAAHRLGVGQSEVSKEVKSIVRKSQGGP